MKIIAVAVTIQLLAGAPPDVNVMPGLTMSPLECDRFVDKLDAASEPAMGKRDYQGRMILAEFHKCMPLVLDTDDLDEKK